MNVCACVRVFVREKAKWLYVCFVLPDELVYLYTSFIFLYERKEIVRILLCVINMKKIKMTNGFNITVTFQTVAHMVNNV